MEAYDCLLRKHIKLWSAVLQKNFKFIGFSVLDKNIFIGVLPYISRLSILVNGHLCEFLLLHPRNAPHEMWLHSGDKIVCIRGKNLSKLKQEDHSGPVSLP